MVAWISSYKVHIDQILCNALNTYSNSNIVMHYCNSRILAVIHKITAVDLRPKYEFFYFMNLNAGHIFSCRKELGL